MDSEIFGKMPPTRLFFHCAAAAASCASIAIGSVITLALVLARPLKINRDSLPASES